MSDDKRVVMIMVGIAGREMETMPPRPLYFKSIDPEAHGGRGHVSWTSKLEEAVVFADHAEAMRIYQASPKCRPVGADGRPNKPLTAYTVEITLLSLVRASDTISSVLRETKQ